MPVTVISTVTNTYNRSVDNDMEISKIVEIRGGRDPKSIYVDSDGNIWFSTTVGVFRAIPSE